MKVKRRRKRPETKRKRVRKTTAKTTAPSTGLIPQSHGGALRAGGTPGNAGGTGRPPSQIRAAYAESFDKRRYIFETIADDMREATGDRLAAVRALGRFGLGEKPLEVTDIRQHPDAQRFVSAFHQALAILPAVDAERVRAKVDELLMVLS